MKKIILLVSILMVSVLNAQNLIENGGFEQTRNHLGKVKFEGWEFNYLNQVIGEPHQGRKSAKVYNSGAFRLNKYGKLNLIPIERKAEYTLTFWYKGEESKEIEPYVVWYDRNGKKLSNSDDEISRRTNSPSSWEEKKYVFRAPSSAVSAGLTFKLFGMEGSVTIDDISFEKTGEATSGIEPPTGFKATTYQRELDFSWNSETEEENAQWELVINGESVILDKNYYSLTGLNPNTKYVVKIKTIIDDDSSDFTPEKTIWTKRIEYAEDDDNRVPHLRTLGTYGSCHQKIKLFYNDLYNPNAEINYFVDGKQIQPDGNDFSFPKKGRQVLKVLIKEKEGYEWEIQYNLNVK